MTKYANIYCDGFFDNDIFNPDSPRNRDNCLAPWRQLKNDLLHLGIELNTPDISLKNQYEIFFDLYIDGQKIINDTRPKFLIAIENPVINKFNKNIDYLMKFDHIFSWNSYALSIKNSTKIFFPTDVYSKEFKVKTYTEREIFSCMINANKRLPINDENDLYEERVKIIRWFEKHKSNDFFLFGKGWHKPSPAFTLKEKIIRRLSRILYQTLNKPPFPSWRGELDNKFQTLSNCKFTFCYENSKNFDNYVTEKIIDCFLAGSIPIYQGAKNIENLIPVNCYIDARKFSNVIDIYNYIKSLTSDEYTEVQKNIAKFVLSDDIKKFGPNFFSQKICSIVKVL
jgi:hypothetical protein